MAAFAFFIIRDGVGEAEPDPVAPDPL
jgi:hypothetical protein